MSAILFILYVFGIVFDWAMQYNLNNVCLVTCRHSHSIATAALLLRHSQIE